MAQNRYEPLPEFILNAPELMPIDQPFFDAYVALDSCRQVGFSGGGSIPWGSVIQYGHYLGLEGDDLTDFVDIITLTDNFIALRQQEEQK